MKRIKYDDMKNQQHPSLFSKHLLLKDLEGLHKIATEGTDKHYWRE